MKKALTIAVITAALTGALLAGATTAIATPGKSRSCNACHTPIRSSIVVKVTKVSSTSTKVKYRVTVTGGSGAKGWAVISGGKNIAHGSATTGTFSVAKGKTFAVWGVRKSTGSNRKTMTAR
jgi:hypothetical protein